MGIYRYNVFLPQHAFVQLLLAAKRRILQAILRSHEVYGYSLARELNLDTATVYEHLRALENHGYLKSHIQARRRMYEMTEKGESFLKLL